MTIVLINQLGYYHIYSIPCCVVCLLLFDFVLVFERPMLTLALDCLFLIATSVFSNFYFHVQFLKNTKCMGKSLFCI